MQLTTPKTVAQAIAPFKKMQTNLKAVMDAQARARRDAETKVKNARSEKEAQIAAANKKADTVFSQQGAVIENAMAEEAQAAVFLKNLNKLLENTDANPAIETMSPAEKVNVAHAVKE